MGSEVLVRSSKIGILPALPSKFDGEMTNPYLSSPNPLYSREDKTGAKRGKEDTNKTGPNQTWEHPQTWKVCGIPTVQRTRIPTTTS